MRFIMPLRRYLDAILHLDVRNEKDDETFLFYFILFFFFRIENSIVDSFNSEPRIFH